MYKMIQINKEGYKKCEVAIIDKGRYFGVNRKDLEVDLDVANWAQIISALQVAFKGEIILTQYCIKNKRIDDREPWNYYY